MVLFIFALLIFAAPQSDMTTSITGNVKDSVTGETLPAATILIEEGFKGTISNNEGEFSIETGQLPVTLTVRYIGYHSATIEVTQDTSFPIDVSLEPSTIQMDEIMVTEKDPGLSIMELVIERKKLWRNRLQNYRVEAYTRQVLSGDTSIVSISESSSIAYWDSEMGHREIQKNRRQTLNIGADQNYAGVRYLPNFYDDDIEIAGYKIVGITHPDALRYYHFSLLETTQMDGKPVYKIEVKPRRERQPTFEGVAYVLGREYALLEVELKPNDVVSFPPPVQDFDLAYKQQFSNYGGDFWLPVDVRIDGKIRIGMIGLRFPAMNFRQVSRLSGYELNTEIPDSVFGRSEWLIRDESDPDSVQQPESGMIPLTVEEQLAYESIDSTQTVEEAFRPEGFIARMLERSEGDGDASPGGSPGLLAGTVMPRVHFNRMDGYHLGLNAEHRFRNAGLRLKGFGGYSFHGNTWDFGAEAEQHLFDSGQSGSVSLTAGYKYETDTQYESAYVSRMMNSTASLVGGRDYFDYFRNEKLYTGLNFNRIMPRTDINIRVNRELHRSFDEDAAYDHSLFGWHDPWRVNRTIPEGEIWSASMQLALNRQPNTLGFAGSRSAVIDLEWSDPAFGSDFDFVSLSGTITWNTETFYHRRLFANTLDISLSAGTAWGELPVQRSMSIDGSISFFGPFGTIKTRRGLPYAGSEYWAVSAEHNFRTIPFELLGFTPLVERGWGIILFGGAGEIRSDMSDADGVFQTDGVHSEIGVSLNSVFGIVRIDFAKRLDQPGTFLGIGIPRYF